MMYYTGVSGRARPFLQNISMASCIPTRDHIGSIHERCLIGIGTFAGNTIDGVFGSQFRYVMSMQVRIRWGSGALEAKNCARTVSRPFSCSAATV